MKNYLNLLKGVVLATAISSTANAAVVIEGVDGSMSAGGTITVVDGSVFAPGGSATQVPQRWTDPGPVGTDFVGTFGGTDAASTDWYVTGGNTNGAGAGALNLPATGYLEIFYSLSKAVVGSNQRFAVNSNSPAESFGTGVAAMIPGSAGSHSFVIDVSQLAEVGSELDYIRWDPWNSDRADNAGTTFTIDKLVHGTTLVPEPSTALLGALGMLALLRRRR